MNATSKLTVQGQISVAAAVRRKLGVGPGAILAWESDGDRVVVRRAGARTSVEIHDALFGSEGKPPRKTLSALKAGIAAHVRQRRARG